MQISPASLLTAQQQAPAKAAPEKSVFGSFLNAPQAAPKEAAKTAFQPADFAQSEPQSPAPAAQPVPAQAYQRPGSTLDIRV